MSNRYNRPEPQKKHWTRWLTVWLDLWFLFGFVLGHQTHSSETFLVVCVSGAILTIVHLMFVLK